MKIAIITGGSGPERDVSINSAEFIEQNLTFAEKVESFLYPEEYKDFLVRQQEFNIVVPIIHGDDGEDGSLQEDLDQHNIKYLFSQQEAQQKCFNKENCKQSVQDLGFSTPRTYSIDTLEEVTFPLIAKPQESGSSIGLYFLENKKQLNDLGKLEGYLYEQFISGREFTVGVIETVNDLTVLPVMEIKKSKNVFDYSDKYSEVSNEIEIFPEDLEIDLDNRLKDLALQVHKNLGLKHISRTDCIVSQEGDVYFIETNTIPGCTSTSFIPKMINKAGLNFSELLEHWCKKELT